MPLHDTNKQNWTSLYMWKQLRNIAFFSVKKFSYPLAILAIQKKGEHYKCMQWKPLSRKLKNEKK